MLKPCAFLALFAFVQSTFAFQPNPKINEADAKAMAKRMEAIRCEAGLWDLWLPTHDTKIERIKAMADELKKGDRNQQASFAENVLNESYAQCKDRDYSIETELLDLRKQAVKTLIAADVLPNVLRQNWLGDYAVNLHRVALPAMNSKQLIQYWIIGIGADKTELTDHERRYPLGKEYYLNEVAQKVPFSEVGKYKDEPRLWRALFYGTRIGFNQNESTQKDAAISQKLPAIKAARESLVTQENLEQIMIVFDTLLFNSLTLEELFKHYAKEVTLLNQHAPDFLPRVIADGASKRGRNMPSLDLGGMSAESRAAYNSFSRSARSYGGSRSGSGSGSGSGGSGSSGNTVKLFSEWEREEIEKLLRDKDSLAVSRSRDFLTSTVDRIRVIKSSRLSAVEALQEDIVNILRVCGSAYRNQNEEVYGICIQAARSTLRELSEIAKQDKDVALLLQRFFSDPQNTYAGEFTEVVAPNDKLLENVAKLNATKEAGENFAKTFEGVLQQKLTYRTFLSAQNIKDLEAEARAYEKQIAESKPAKPGEIQMMPYNRAQQILNNLDAPLYLDDYNRTGASGWLVLPRPVQVKAGEVTKPVYFVRVEGGYGSPICRATQLTTVHNIFRSSNRYSGGPFFSYFNWREVPVLNICVEGYLDFAFGSGNYLTVEQRTFVRSLNLPLDNSPVIEAELAPAQESYVESPNPSKKQRFEATAEGVEQSWNRFVTFDKIARALLGGRQSFLQVKLPSQNATKLNEDALLIGELRELPRYSYHSMYKDLTSFTINGLPADSESKSLGEAYIIPKKIVKPPQ